MSCLKQAKSSPHIDQLHNSCSADGKCCQGYLSQIETAILNSTEPIHVCAQNETFTVNGETGIWANKAEAEAWIGPVPINNYPINHDPCPQVINKKPKCVECKREVFVKYLEPPKIPQPGAIIINQEANKLAPPAPPIIIRQVPCKPVEPEQLVIRETPPQQPKPPHEKVITIPGSLLPPPPRKVIIERLPEMPTKPQDIILERWLPFKDEKRRIKLNPKPADPVQCKPRNIIINWEKIECSKVNTDIRNLGIEKADPVAYAQQYGASLKTASELPEIANEVKVLHGIPLAAENTHKYYMELEGDIHALALIDLDKEGLSEYKHYLEFLKNPQAQQICDEPLLQLEDSNKQHHPLSIASSVAPEQIDSIDSPNYGKPEYHDEEPQSQSQPQKQQQQQQVKVSNTIHSPDSVNVIPPTLPSLVEEVLKADLISQEAAKLEQLEQEISSFKHDDSYASTEEAIKDYIYNTVDKLFSKVIEQEKSIEEQKREAEIEAAALIAAQNKAKEIELENLDVDVKEVQSVEQNELSAKELIEQKIREEEEEEVEEEDEEEEEEEEQTVAEMPSEHKTVTELVISSTVAELNMSTSTPFSSITDKSSIEQKLEQLKLQAMSEQISEIEKSLQNKLKQEVMKQEQLKTELISEGIDETMNDKTLGITKSLTESIVAEMTEQQTAADTTLTSEKEIYDQSTVGDISFDHHDEPASTASLEAAVDFLVEKLVKIVREGSFE